MSNFSLFINKEKGDFYVYNYFITNRTKKIEIGKSVLIESGTDSNTNYWYRLWSDGWCEQGGVAQLDNKANYLRVYPTKEYKDTSYEVVQMMVVG
mgnify:CR=1 FL=1